MTKKKEAENGEQMQLIDVLPEGSEEIVKAIKAYKKVQTVRLKALKEETQRKQEVLELVRGSELQRLPNGNIEFSYDGWDICVAPRDDLITIVKHKPKKAKKVKEEAPKE